MTTVTDTRKKVAIVGFAHSRHYVPWMATDTQFWGFNDPDPDLWERIKYPFARWYQLHQRTYLDRGQPTPMHCAAFTARTLPKYREMRTVPLYVWTPADWHDCPTATAFPKEAVEGLTPHGGYHLSSVDWMVAHAILEGATHISVYGILFSPNEGGEPAGARACLEYWLGVAEGRGIVVQVEGGAMFKTYQWTSSHKQYGAEYYPNEVET